ncbi:MAG: hypothetical protein WAU75_21205 [Solirubrobacteraceae bacterium]
MKLLQVNYRRERGRHDPEQADTEEHARTRGDDMLSNSLGRLSGVSGTQARLFDVDERRSAITRGPVRACEAV